MILLIKKISTLVLVLAFTVTLIGCGNDQSTTTPEPEPEPEVTPANQDTDFDGINDSNDNCLTVANNNQVNSDGDSFGDACDADRDGDSVNNISDNCIDQPNTDQLNTDADSFGDACDSDQDDDSLPNAQDNCPLVANANQANADDDSAGDACDNNVDGDDQVNDTDNCPMIANNNQADSDSDTVGDVCDNCPQLSNVGQTNSDGDAAGDLCDAFPLNPAEVIDTDADSIGDNADNCDAVANADQKNTDNDAFGDACDDDIDNDGKLNAQDNCPLVTNADQKNTDGDAQGDACDDDDDGDGVLSTVDNCPLKPNANQTDTDSDGVGNVCDNCASVSNANQADSDTDAVGNVCDNCVNVANKGQSDLDTDNMGDVCDADADGDGVAKANGDCNDLNENIKPGATEVFDLVDNDCNGQVDKVLNVSVSAASRISGKNAGDFFGKKVTLLASINQDAYADIAIAAPNNDDAGAESGKIYFYLGKQSMAADPNSQNADFVISGIAGLRLGQVVTGVGDVNGDSLNDFIISSQRFDSNKGRVYLFYGRAQWGNKTLADADVVFTGEQNNAYLGFSAAAAGDVNNDGCADLIMGAYGMGSALHPNKGKVYLVYGRGTCNNEPVFAAQFNVGNQSDAVFVGERDNDALGVVVTGIGDFNADGNDDLALLAPAFDTAANQNDNIGRIYLVYGGEAESELNGNIDLATDTRVSFINGVESNAGFGQSIFGADLNKDGKSDLVIAAPDSDLVSQAGGVVWLYYGRNQVLADTNVSTASTQISPQAAGSHLGSAMAASDLDSDTVADLIFGAPGYSQEFGRTYYVKGIKNMELADLSVSGSSAIFEGAQIGEGSGFSVSGGYDVNGDGAQDMIVGAPNWDRNFTQDVGQAYFIKGIKKLTIGLGIGNSLPPISVIPGGFNYQPVQPINPFNP